jgi:predicted nucleotidyltransferase
MAKPIELSPETENVVEVLRDKKRMLRKDFGVIRIGVFGHIPKSEVIDNRDLNILVEVNNTRLDLWRKLKTFLEEALEQPINLIAKGSALSEKLEITNKKVRRLVAFA